MLAAGSGGFQRVSRRITGVVCRPIWDKNPSGCRGSRKSRSGGAERDQGVHVGASVLERIEVDVEACSRLNSLLATMNDAAGKLDIDAIQQRAIALLDDLQAASKELRIELAQVDTGKVSGSLTTTLDRLSVTLIDLQRLLQSQAGIGEPDNAWMSENLHDWSETLRSYPSLLLGEPPAPTPKEEK
jgi:hypothetical protein